jgi:hypothetical protein
MNDKVHLEYKQSLKTDYTGNYMEIIFDKKNNIFEKIYLYNHKYGTIEFSGNKKQIHKWEMEDEAQYGSYLKRHYPIICLDGITEDRELEENIIGENMNYIAALNLEKSQTEIINTAIDFLKSMT